jgi:sirohydrochlorin ferrochelatase
MTTGRALVIVAHGSRREESNDEVRAFGERLFARLGKDKYTAFATAFLELAEPSIADAIQTCIRAGATHVDVLPYFLSVGRHVNEDVPELARMAIATAPGVTMRMLPYIGANNRLLDVATALISQN